MNDNYKHAMYNSNTRDNISITIYGKGNARYKSESIDIHDDDLELEGTWKLEESLVS